MLSAYAQDYERLWNRHWWWQARKHFVTRRVAALARQRPLADILDIGCGNGLFFDTLSRFGNVRGVEPDAGLVADDGPWRSHITVCPFGPAYHTDQQFDLVLMLDVLEHIPDDADAARRVFDLLRPGGFFLVTVPALMSLWSMHDVINQHHRRYTRATLRSVLANAGFELLTLKYFFAWTVAPMLLRRLLKSGAGRKEDYKVAVPPAPLNAVLYAVSRIEQILLTPTGAPAGSSILAITRKPDP